jgi:hypothetical protein
MCIPDIGIKYGIMHKEINDVHKPNTDYTCMALIRCLYQYGTKFLTWYIDELE